MFWRQVGWGSSGQSNPHSAAAARRLGIKEKRTLY